MTLAGFKARNHPQQVLFHGPRLTVDDRETAPELFAALDRRFRFTVDAAASPRNAKLPRYWTREHNGLEQDWRGERVWCNPPYSDMGAWVRKAAGAGAELVVMLAPANRTEQSWWQELIEPRRDRGNGLVVEFLPGRLRFAGSIPNSRPPFGCCLIIWGCS
jgi:phage N-6-adenine-methyltransferase